MDAERQERFWWIYAERKAERIPTGKKILVVIRRSETQSEYPPVKKILVVIRLGETPVPIPNTKVKT